jgi:hypothetical protein
MVYHRLLSVFMFIAGVSFAALPLGAEEFSVEPTTIALTDPFANRQILVRLGDKDVTHQAGEVA